MNIQRALIIVLAEYVNVLSSAFSKGLWLCFIEGIGTGTIFYGVVQPHIQ